MQSPLCAISHVYDTCSKPFIPMLRQMKALGIDLGGTKIEAQVFDADWSPVERKRVATPGTYPDLLAALKDIADWADDQAGVSLPVGVGAAGAINPADGIILAANLAANDHPLPSDLSTAIGRPVTYLNDSRALALSESVFGAGRPHNSVFALVLGTGVGGGFVRAGVLQAGASGTAGEVGHIAAPAHLVQKYGLPVLDCPCGRQGCIELLISGAGLTRLAGVMTGAQLTSPQIIALRDTDPKMQAVWQVWCAFTAELIQTLTLTLDPDCIVLGGGMSVIPGIVEDLTHATAQAQFVGFASPVILRAEGGAESGARGAAYAAWQVSLG